MAAGGRHGTRPEGPHARRVTRVTKATTKAQTSWSAAEVSSIAAAMGAASWTDVRVRGLARASLPRFTQRNADGTNRTHRYTRAEVTALLSTIATRHERRTSNAVTLPAPFRPVARAKRATKPRATVAAVTDGAES